jgi:AbrB family looped-hinge helix DNA binding protein
MSSRVTTKVGPKFQVVIPKKLRETAGVRVGDLFAAELRREGILLKPLTVAERDFKTEIEGHLTEAEADIKAGRVLGPFDDANDALRAVKDFAKKRPHALAHHREIRRPTR